MLHVSGLSPEQESSFEWEEVEQEAGSMISFDLLDDGYDDFFVDYVDAFKGFQSHQLFQDIDLFIVNEIKKKGFIQKVVALLDERGD